MAAWRCHSESPMSAPTRLSVSSYAARAPHWAAHALGREGAGGAGGGGMSVASTPLPKALAAGASARHHGNPQRLALRACAGLTDRRCCVSAVAPQRAERR